MKVWLTDLRPDDRRGVLMTDSWALFDVGLWTVFAAWAFAIHLCQDDSA